jgi:cytochrome c oxidase subunit 3
MADHHEVAHDYHLVDPSPWPILAAASALATAVGLIWYLHEGPIWIFVIGLVAMLYFAFVWWRDIIREAVHEGHHTPVVQLHMRYGMILFISSEVMFFVAWFWAYFDAALYPPAVLGGVWPPEGVETFNPWHLPLINTLILLTSSTTVTWAHHAVREGNQKSATNGLLITCILGAIFTVVQGYEYSQAAFAFGGDIYGSTFYMATGFHGAHVLIGTIFLIVCLFRNVAGQFKPEHHFGLEAAAWYWHFVDVVWLFLFACIYVWGASAVTH